jgi:hypothetical protein
VGEKPLAAEDVMKQEFLATPIFGAAHEHTENKQAGQHKCNQAGGSEE